MKRAVSVFLFVLSFILTACEHKELCFEHPHFNLLRVEFNWSRLHGHEKPQGMRAIFFPLYDGGESWFFDFPGGEGALIELPENDYGVICFNYDTDGIVYKNNNSYTGFTAYTPDMQLPDGKQAYATPSWLCGDHINIVELKNSTETAVQVVTLFPETMVCRYTFEVNGIRKIERVDGVMASLSGMSGELLMSENKLPDRLSESLLFRGEVSGDKITGGFYTFGYCQERIEPNIFKLYIKSKAGKIFMHEQDVSKQIYAVPVLGHIGNVHIVMNVNLEITDDHASGDYPGFDIDVNDWTDIYENINF